MSMSMTLPEAVEAIARIAERAFLSRSPFHLASCGGCGGPAFQQPCALCSFYPMGSDKGTWDPRRADKGFFCERVAASSPGGNGNLATWYLSSFRKTVAYAQGGGFERSVEAAVEEASGLLGLPSPEDVFEAVSVRGERVGRTPDREAEVLWRVIGEARQFGDPLPGETAVLGECVAAIHSDDRDRLYEAAAKLGDVLRDMTARKPRNGNLHYALATLAEVDAAGSPRP